MTATAESEHPRSGAPQQIALNAAVVAEVLWIAALAWMALAG